MQVLQRVQYNSGVRLLFYGRSSFRHCPWILPPIQTEYNVAL